MLFFIISFSIIYLLFRFLNNSVFFQFKYHVEHFKISPFPIDIVYTWVDGRDPKWLNEFSKIQKERNISFNEKEFLNRFVDIEELRYSLRSVEKNAPWIRYIFIVTCEQYPYWINITHPKLKFISHSQIFPRDFKLPTFNSNSIDFLLYRIPNLSEHFIYSNDDMFFCRPIEYTDFFTKDGIPLIISKQRSWSNVITLNEKSKEVFLLNGGDGGFQFIALTTHTIIRFLEKYNRTMPFEYSHIPFPLTKTICDEVYSIFKEDIDNTISNSIRTVDDFQMQTLIVQYSLFTNKSIRIPNNDSLSTFVVASSTNPNFMSLPEIAENLPKFLSINIDDSDRRGLIQGFLDYLFEKPSSFELKGKLPNPCSEKQFWITKHQGFLEKSSKKREKTHIS